MRKRKLDYPKWFLDEIVDSLVRENINNYPQESNILFRCTVCGCEYLQTIHNHIYSDNRPKQGCPKCGRGKQAQSVSTRAKSKRKPYPEWFIDEIYLDKDKEKAKQGFLKSEDHIDFICKECGLIYNQRVASHITLSTGIRKKGCPNCGIKKQLLSCRVKKNIIKPYPEWFIEDLYLDEDKEKARKSNFYGYEEKQFYCKKHNLVYIKKVRDHIDLRTHKVKALCPECSLEKQKETLTTKRKYPEWFIEDLYLDEDKEKAREGILTSKDNVQFYCTKHGIYERHITEHINLSTGERKRGCPKCGYEKFLKNLSEKRRYPKWFIEDLYLDEDKEKAHKGLLTTSTVVTFKCNKGHIYKQGVNAHIILSTHERNRGCPYCSHNRSTGEINIEDYIKALGLKTEHKRFKSKILPLFETDIYIPEKKIAIEYNGSYFHKTLPVDGNDKPRMYHNQKYYACRELGICLISIFDVDWKYKKEKIKQYLRDLLLPIENKLYARKCKLRQIDLQSANLMYDQYHLLGKTTIQDVSYGLFYNNELISCMSFQKGRYTENKDSVWCLTRFVTKSGYSIIGGASKLLAQFEKEYHPDILLSYSDNDYFTGGLYSKLGFVCMGDTKSPRYYWCLDGQELKREQCQLKHLSKKCPELYKEAIKIKGNKEDYIMLNLGAYKVYRSGHTKWIKKY